MQRIHSGFLKLALTAMMLLGTTMVVTPAMADSVTWEFTGIVDSSDFVDSSDNTIPPPFSPVPFTTGLVALNGAFTFEGNTVNLLQGLSSVTGVYGNPITNLTFTLGSNSYNDTTPSSSSNSILVQNNLGFGISIKDQYQLERGISGDSAGGGYNPLEFKIDILGDANGTHRLFDNTSLPLLPPGVDSIGNFKTLNGVFPTFRVTFTDGTNSLVVAGTLTNLVATPLPPAVILFGAGLVALIGLGARRRWQASSIA
jgi:hypothetical protein